jgi:hypothetical protein
MNSRVRLAVISFAILLPAVALAQGSGSQGNGNNNQSGNPGTGTQGDAGNNQCGTQGDGNINQSGEDDALDNETLAAAPDIEAAGAALEGAFLQLRADVRAGNTTAYAADAARISAAFAKLQAGRKALRAAIAGNAAVLAAKSLVDADRRVVESAQLQLTIDEIVGIPSVIAADEAALSTAQGKLRSDLRALKAAIAVLRL